MFRNRILTLVFTFHLYIIVSKSHLLQKIHRKIVNSQGTGKNSDVTQKDLSFAQYNNQRQQSNESTFQIQNMPNLTLSVSVIFNLPRISSHANSTKGQCQQSSQRRNRTQPPSYQDHISKVNYQNRSHLFAGNNQQGNQKRNSSKIQTAHRHLVSYIGYQSGFSFSQSPIINQTVYNISFPYLYAGQQGHYYLLEETTASHYMCDCKDTATYMAQAVQAIQNQLGGFGLPHSVNVNQVTTFTQQLKLTMQKLVIYFQHIVLCVAGILVAEWTKLSLMKLLRFCLQLLLAVMRLLVQKALQVTFLEHCFTTQPHILQQIKQLGHRANEIEKLQPIIEKLVVVCNRYLSVCLGQSAEVKTESKIQDVLSFLSSISTDKMERSILRKSKTTV